MVGGGINGAGIARDAAMRGLDTLLLEKEDFASGTTSRSSRLIHGGLRYLRHLGFGLVRQDMREREILLRIAPHLVKRQPFLIPITGRTERAVMAAGMRLYDLLSYDKSLPRSHFLSRRETLQIEPGLETFGGLSGSYLYYDCQVAYTERLCLETALSAAENGAVALNHTRATALTRDGGRVTGVEVEDVPTGEKISVSARLVVNAAGHWMDTLGGQPEASRKPLIRRTKGIHLVTPRLFSQALVLFSHTDGRLFFVIPWLDYSLTGTTDTDYSGSLDEVAADGSDTAYLLNELRRLKPDITGEDIHYATAGLRALAVSRDKKPSNLSRSHKLIDHEKTDNTGGLVTLLGGKITGYRGIAEETVNLVCRKLGIEASCRTAEVPLPGAPAVSEEAIDAVTTETGLPGETVRHLASLYGSCFSEVAALAREDGGSRVICSHSGDTAAQVRHAVAEESALTAADFLLRRGASGLASCQGLDAAEVVTEEMGLLLGWDAAERQRQTDDYHRRAALDQRFRAL